VSALLVDVANITVATHRYVWRGVKNANYGLHSALERRLRASGLAVTSAELKARELQLLASARAAGLGYGDHQLTDADLLALLQHAGASTSLIDVTPDPFVALFFATEPVGEPAPCALIAIKVHGRTPAEQASHTVQGPLENAPDKSVYERLGDRLALPPATVEPILWEAPFVDNRMRVQRGMFLATTAALDPVDYASFNPDLGVPTVERRRVANVCRRAPGKWTRPSLVVFYISKALRQQATAELDKRFGYRTETIYPDLAGFALANAWNRSLG